MRMDARADARADLHARLKTFMAEEVLPRCPEIRAFTAANPPGARPPVIAALKTRARAQGPHEPPFTCRFACTAPRVYVS